MTEDQPVIEPNVGQPVIPAQRAPASSSLEEAAPLQKQQESPEEPQGINLPGPEQDLGQGGVQGGQAGAAIQGTSSDRLHAVLQEASASSPIGVPGFITSDPGFIERFYQQHEAEKEDKEESIPNLSPDDANKRFPGMPVPFNAPISPRVAELMYNNQQHRIQVQAMKDGSAPLPFGVETVTGLMAGMADPLMATTMFFGGGAMKLAGVSSSIADVGLVGAIKNSAIENLVLNTAIGGAGYLQEKSEHGATDITQTVEGILAGTAIGVGIHVAVLEPLYHVLGLAQQSVKKVPTDIQEQNLKTAFAQHELGSKIDVSGTSIELEKRISGETRDGNRPYTFKPADENTTYYVAKDSNGNAVEYHPFDKGIQAVDDPHVANNMISNPSGEPGRMGELKIPEGSKILDIDQSAFTPEMKKFEAEISEKLGAKLDVQPEDSIKDVLTRLGGMAERGDAPHDILSQVQDIATREGFSGFSHVLGDEVSGNQKNALHLFDEKPQVKELGVDPDLTPVSSENLKIADNLKMDHPENDANYSPEIGKIVRDFKHGHPLNSTPEFMDPIVDEMTKSSRIRLDELAKSDPELREELRALDQATKTEVQKGQLLKDFVDCVVSS